MLQSWRKGDSIGALCSFESKNKPIVELHSPSVLQSSPFFSGISYDKPLPPIQVASQRAERIAKEKKVIFKYFSKLFYILKVIATIKVLLITYLHFFTGPGGAAEGPAAGSAAAGRRPSGCRRTGPGADPRYRPGSGRSGGCSGRSHCCAQRRRTGELQPIRVEMIMKKNKLLEKSIHEKKSINLNI